jgi:hypothetical protein
MYFERMSIGSGGIQMVAKMRFMNEREGIEYSYRISRNSKWLYRTFRE